MPGHEFPSSIRQAMLLSKIAGTASWLVQRQSHRPAVWHESTQRVEDDML